MVRDLSQAKRLLRALHGALLAHPHQTLGALLMEMVDGDGTDLMRWNDDLITAYLQERVSMSENSHSGPPTMAEGEREAWREEVTWIVQELNPLFDMPDDGHQERRADRLMRLLGVITWWMETRRPFTARDVEQIQRAKEMVQQMKLCRTGVNRGE